MQKEINGVIYDTQNSTVNKKFTFGTPGDIFGYEETLYITSDGKYFVYTNGGIQSKHPKENIFALEKSQVKSWILSR